MQDKGFSLLEVVIVAAIVAILAALALPRASRGSKGSGEAALEADLEVLRKAIDLFAAEHHGRYPSGDTIASQLTGYTDWQGNAQGAKDALHIYGPYLRAIPPLPVGAKKGCTKIATSDGPGIGWIYAPASGKIRANTGTLEVSTSGLRYRDF
jgi:prepilin-type N-terminal cleavage/methylation domain-containing protein